MFRTLKPTKRKQDHTTTLTLKIENVIFSGRIEFVDFVGGNTQFLSSS